MSKQLRFTYDDREYVLEYTRKTVEMMEKKGFVASEIESKPMSTLPALFAGAFLANHRFVKQDVIDKIYSKIREKGELISKLAEMYNEPIAALLDEPEETDKDFVEWTASW